jgi:hypothetical protein
MIPSAKSPFAVEVLVGPVGKTATTLCKPQIKDHDFYVDAQKDEIYAVRLHNTSAKMAAVTLAIDGLSVFALSELRDAKTGKPRYSHLLVPPNGVVTVAGWHRRNDAADAGSPFRLNCYGGSADALMQSPTGKVSVIAATFAYGWKKSEEPPRDTYELRETGTGPPAHAKGEDQTWALDPVRDVVCIRVPR